MVLVAACAVDSVDQGASPTGVDEDRAISLVASEDNPWGLRLAREATSLGGVETLIRLPHNTSHVAMSPAERRAAGIEPGMARLSVGIEDPADLVGDLRVALT